MTGEGGGLPKDEVDRRVADLVAVIGGGKKKDEDEPPADAAPGDGAEDAR